MLSAQQVKKTVTLTKYCSYFVVVPTRLWKKEHRSILIYAYSYLFLFVLNAANFIYTLQNKEKFDLFWADLFFPFLMLLIFFKLKAINKLNFFILCTLGSGVIFRFITNNL
jgi:hypothetical protein